MPVNPLLRSSALLQKLYDREIGVYCHLFPALRKLRAQAGLSNVEVPFDVPDIYYVSLQRSSAEYGVERPAVLVMEDLRIQEFQMVDKRVGCSYEQAKATMTTLANFHALSIALVRQWKTSTGQLALPEHLQFLKQKAKFDEMGPTLAAINLPVFHEVMRRMGHREAAAWFEKETKNLAITMAAGEASPLDCILHGDCWNNNIMYRYEQGKPVEVRLFDWQILKLDHPVMDLVVYLFTSTSHEVRTEHQTNLLAHYFTILNGSLHMLGIHLDREGYTEEHFQREVKMRLKSVMCLSIMFLNNMLSTEILSVVDNADKCETDHISTTHYKDVDHLFEDIMKKLEETKLTVEEVLENQLLCDRVSGLVLEMYAAHQ